MLFYALTIFISSFLLFQVQPVIARMILPWFGGSASVWSTCMLFFQAVLVLGYLYAHATTRHLRPAAQAGLHVALLAISLLLLPIVPDAHWKPTGAEDPTLRILGLLAVTVGLPYLVLSTTGPLLQAWYAASAAGKRPVMPYRLYSLSNIGSMLALLSYPFLFEPVFTTQQQGSGWSWGYVGFAVCCAITALQFVRSRPARAAAAVEEAAPAPPGWPLYLLWIALPACASILLLAVTNHLSQNIAAIPFLWVVPLSLYLLSFVFCFERDGWYRRALFLPLLVVALAVLAATLHEGVQNRWNVRYPVILCNVALFVCCMVCHGELARLKPHPRYLTAFYLMLSVGGAVGGVFVGLLAPRLFKAYYELPVGLLLCALLVLLVARPRALTPQRAAAWGAWAAGALLTVGLVVYLGALLRRPTENCLLMVRNFYGGLRVNEVRLDQTESIRAMAHGTINHGAQFQSPERRGLPITYFAPHAGLGRAIREGQRRPNQTVGVLGLGIGTIAAYGRAGDRYRFYEINPLVIEIARNYFSYLGNSPAKIEVALGDARLSLEREPPQGFDILVMDAFSGDSIPTHLVTREAFALYFRHLKESGVVAVNVTNMYLDIAPVVKRAAAEFGKRAVVIDSYDELDRGILSARWVLISGRADFFTHPEIAAVAQPIPDRDWRLWTDAYSNLFQTLK